MNSNSISQAVYELQRFEEYEMENTHTRARASGRQLKITFLDVLDYSEYCDTYSISRFFFNENIASLVRKQNRPC